MAIRSVYGGRVHMGYGACSHGTGYVNSGKPIFLCGDWNAGPGSDEIALMKEFMTIISPTNGVRTYHGRKATGGREKGKVRNAETELTGEKTV